MDLTNVTIGTNRLILKSLTPAWREDLFREFTDEVTVYMHPKAAETIADTDVFIAESIKKMTNGYELIAAVTDRETQEFLGVVGVHELDTVHPELGVWIKKTAHGHLYGREAVTGLKEWLDTKGYTYEYLRYPVSKANIASRKIPESLGGVVAREMKTLSASGKELDEVEYRILN
jgi:RimJ/RimL family protein N-acetyltransferase